MNPRGRPLRGGMWGTCISLELGQFFLLDCRCTATCRKGRLTVSHDCVDLVQRRPQRRIEGRCRIALLDSEEREEVAHVLRNIVLLCTLVHEDGPFVGVGCGK